MQTMDAMQMDAVPQWETTYRQACARIYARWQRGEITATQMRDRHASVRDRRDERAAKWHRAEFRAWYQGLGPGGRARVRLRARAQRPRL